ncbi:MAG: hypothetical protein KA941_13575 [Flavobacteriales bacterium]|nr:hypothetical protein [Flavobacteriales bacterium]
MRTLLLLSFSVLGLAAHAREAAPSWLEATLYGNGKINVVLIVVGVIIAGIGIWMFRMDRKITHMEQRMKK